LHWKTAIPSHIDHLMAANRIGIISDMDGTLSPIVANKDAARPTPRNLELLRQLNEQVALVAVVSGRGVQDLQQRVGIPDLVYVGNHGLERGQNGKVEPHPDTTRYQDTLQKFMQHIVLLPGMELEDKGATLSIHYRNAKDEAAVVNDFLPTLHTLAHEYGLKVHMGKKVYEVRPPLDINKGTALKQLIQDFNLQAVIFLGDDTTDADAMKMAQQLRQENTCYALALGVESEETPPEVQESADFFALDVSDVEAFLEAISTFISRKAS